MHNHFCAIWILLPFFMEKVNKFILLNTLYKTFCYICLHPHSKTLPMQENEKKKKETKKEFEKKMFSVNSKNVIFAMKREILMETNVCTAPKCNYSVTKQQFYNNPTMLFFSSYFIFGRMHHV